MDEQNEQQQFFRIEPQQDAPAQPQAAPAAPEQASEQFQAPDKKTRRKLFALIACMALVAALGGSALTAAIRAISDRNAAYQESLSEQSEPATAPEQQPEKSYTLEKSALPETLPSNPSTKALTPAEV